jgi:transglutaminase-like putative cysteine protease/tetratricopeptide (TPR) repeat protein
MRSPFWISMAAVFAVSTLPAGAAEAWDAPAFSVPARDLLQAATAVKREHPTAVVVLLDERTFVLDEQHRLTSIARLIYRIDSPDGVERWAASTARWQPWHQSKPTIRARVITLDGQEHQIDQKLLTDAANRSEDNQIYDDSHTLEGPLPAVAIGAVIEEEITVRDEKPFFAAGSVYREYIGRPMPVLRTRIAIDAPESLPLKHYMQLLPKAVVQEVRANGRVMWTMDHGLIDGMGEMDSNLPPDAPAWPAVEFTSATSWEAVAATYRDMTEARIRNDDAKPLIAGLKTPLRNSPTREYIAKVVERLHREVRYTGVEFADARLVPEYPAETLRRRFGDCKDKSTLLVAALRASGIDAYLALLSSGDDQDVSPDLPGLGMFNHAIVYVPGAQDLWIDATAEYTRVGTLPPANTDRLALVIRAGEKNLTRTPALNSADNRQLETRDVFLAEYGPARVIETTETHGTIEGEFRSWYAGADNKARLDDLTSYARSAYRAKSLEKYEHTASTDFSKPYSMSLEMKDAPVGFTDLHTSAVGIKVSNIASRLPSYFDDRLKEEESVTESDARTADVVFEPFVTEWRYRIRPPLGFQARKLPADSVQNLGPARLASEFRVAADGTVNATWRFDTLKRRYTPAETTALLAALRELKDAETQLISFDQVGVALRADGDFKGALRANDELVVKYPRKAVHRLRSATALLEAGLGTRAQKEALAATKLEPKSALAWKTLGWMLQHDAVGRRFGEGFDRAGALAAYHKAQVLEPDNADISADLAVLLEHDAFGVRYSPKSDLDEAIDNYQLRRAALSEEDAKDDSYANNLLYALLYAQRYGELREALRKLPPGATQRALMLAAIGAESGGARALEFARDLSMDAADRRTALASAGNLLARLRAYSSAADLIEASTRGQTTTAASTQRIAMLRKTQRNDGKPIEPTDPRGVVLRWLVELLSVEKNEDGLRKLLAPGSEFVVDSADFVAARRGIVAGLRKQDLPYEVTTDILFSNVRVNVEGDDAGGYRVQLRMTGETQTFYVVKTGGGYRILTAESLLGPVALKAQERIDADDFAGARRWLDWARVEQRPSNTDDPLAGPSFSRAWTVGAETDLAAARAATAMLLADSGLAERAVPLLVAARSADVSAADKLSLDLALARAYLDLERWADLREVALRLVAAVPNSAQAVRYQQWALIQLGQWDAVEKAARERLARLPDDSLAREILVRRAEARGEFRTISGIMQPLIDSGRATASDYNQYAWTSLLTQPVDERAVDAARMAYDETQGKSYAIAHTLACVYAATGKPREARDLLLKGMEMVGIDRPDNSAWYGFGLVAEAYGDTESARDYYAKVEKPKKGMIEPSSVYALTQARLTALK